VGGGPKWAETGMWAALEKEKRGGKLGGPRGWACFFFFQILFKPFQTFLLYLFKSNFNTNSPTILRLLENLLNKFSNIF
jgi:hypothetical protein